MRVAAPSPCFSVFRCPLATRFRTARWLMPRERATARASRRPAASSSTAIANCPFQAHPTWAIVADQNAEKPCLLTQFSLTVRNTRLLPRLVVRRLFAAKTTTGSHVTAARHVADIRPRPRCSRWQAREDRRVLLQALVDLIQGELRLGAGDGGEAILAHGLPLAPLAALGAPMTLDAALVLGDDQVRSKGRNLPVS